MVKKKKTIKSYIYTNYFIIKEITWALIVCACDPDKRVRASIVNSLNEIGHRKPVLVISACVDWVLKYPKADNEHKITVMNVAYKLIDERTDDVTRELALFAVRMAMEQLTLDRDVVPDLQEQACSILVALANLVPDKIIDDLMANFTPGQVPHYFIIKTLGDVALANPTGVVPRLRDAVTRMNPLLASLKHDNLKWVFATTLWEFCQAIQSYVANRENGSAKGRVSGSVDTGSFSGEMYSAFEFLLTKWALARDKRLLLAVYRAMGQMTGILQPDQYEIVLPKFLPGIVGLIKKEKEILNLMEGLCTALEMGVRIRSPTLGQPLTLAPVLAALHAIASNVPEFTNIPAVKIYSESLRCFEVLARGWPEQVVSFILSKLEPSNVPSRLGALAVIKHLVVSVSTELADRKGLIVSGVKPLVASETNIAVKKSLAQLIGAMAQHDYLQLEGGESLVEFVVRGSAYEDPHTEGSGGNSKKNAANAAEVAGNRELRDICDNFLSLSTNIPGMENVLWPYLFEFVVNPKYSGAISVVAKVLAHIGAQKRGSGDEEGGGGGAEDYWIDFDKHINLPKPPAIIAKLFVLICVPTRRPGQGVNIFNALRAVGPILHPSACDMWDEKIPKLVSYLEEKLRRGGSNGNGEWDAASWEELILRLLAETVRIANDDEWAMSLGDALCREIEVYTGDSYMRHIAMRLLGVVLQRVTSRDYIGSKIEFLFQTANHAVDIERQGCANAYGFCSASHLDTILEKLQAIYPACTGKQGGGGFFSRKSTGPSYSPDARNTVILAYGYVASLANVSLITSRVEIHIVAVIKKYFNVPKMAITQRVAVANAINLIARAMHPSHLKESFEFKGRDDLLATIIDYLGLRDAELDTQLRLACLEALASLCLLQPTLPDDLLERVVAAATHTFVLNVVPTNDAGKYAPGTCDDAQMAQIMAKVDNLLAALLFMNPAISDLRKLMHYLEPIVVIASDTQRERAVASILALLRKFIQFASSPRRGATSTTADTHYDKLGESIVIPLPRCADTVPHIRRSAIECVGLMLYIDHILTVGANNSNGSGGAVPPPAYLKQLNATRDKVERGDIAAQLKGIEDLAGILCEAVSAEEMHAFVIAAIQSLHDPHTTGQLAVATALTVVCTKRGAEFESFVGEIVEQFIVTIRDVTDEEAADKAVGALCALAQHHMKAVVSLLLDEPVPHTPSVRRIFQALIRDTTLAQPIIELLTGSLNTSCLHEEKYTQNKVTYIPLHASMTTTVALSEALELCAADAAVSKALLDTNFARLFGTVILRIGSAALAEARAFTPRPLGTEGGAAKPVTITPQSQAAEAARQFVGCLGKGAAIAAELDSAGAWALMESKTNYYDGIVAFTHAVLGGAYVERSEEVYKFLVPFLRGNYPEQRVATTVVFAEMISHCGAYPELIERLVIAMTEGLADNLLKVHVFRGLGNIAGAGPVHIDKYASTVIDALTPPLSGADERLTIEAISGLEKIFEVVDEANVAPFIVNICAQIRPSFEKNNVVIRGAAFRIFGNLARFGASKACAERFYEQVHAALPSILLHLNDDNVEVQKACKVALRRIAPLTQSDSFVEVAERPLFNPDAPVTQYDVMAEELAKQLIATFPDRISTYVAHLTENYRSQWNRIKANAAVMTGAFLGNLPPEKRNKATLNATIITRALISLMRDKNAEVRQRAAEAMAVLYTY